MEVNYTEQMALKKSVDGAKKVIKNEPNEETLKAFKETDEGKGLVRCKDFNDFIDKFRLK